MNQPLNRRPCESPGCTSKVDPGNEHTQITTEHNPSSYASSGCWWVFRRRRRACETTGRVIWHRERDETKRQCCCSPVVVVPLINAKYVVFILNLRPAELEQPGEKTDKQTSHTETRKRNQTQDHKPPEASQIADACGQRAPVAVPSVNLRARK